MTLRITARFADSWHGFGDPATMRHKCAVLDDWCAKVGRDPKEIERCVTVNFPGRHGPDDYLAFGVTHFLVSADGPRYDLGPLRELVAWRDARRPG